jgi:hypothetical protein
MFVVILNSKINVEINHYFSYICLHILYSAYIVLNFKLTKSKDVFAVTGEYPRSLPGAYYTLLYTSSQSIPFFSGAED